MSATDASQSVMKRSSEIVHNLGFNILFPRICLHGMVPGIILVWPGSMALFASWPIAFDKGVIILFGCLLLIDITANLGISRYLRIHRTSASPYEYCAAEKLFVHTPYFRIRVADRVEFRALIKSLRREQKGQAIWVWLWLNDLMFGSTLTALLIMLVPYFLWIGGERLISDMKQRLPKMT